MFHKLEIKNAFNHKDRVFEFSEGLTTITGPNGSGKTLITELLSFLLWGSWALRGTAPDYKGMWVAGEMTIRGTRYRIERTTSTAVLKHDGKMIASGVTPVNNKIKELFGYNSDVYSVANIARQGEIESMGKMKPSERKNLIDQTIGLAKIDSLFEDARYEAIAFDTKVKTLKSVTCPPEDLPEAPPTVEKSYLSTLQFQYATLKASEPFLTPPVPVPAHDRAPELGALKAQQQARGQALAQAAALDKALAAFTPLGEKPPEHPQAGTLLELQALTLKHQEAKSQLKVLQNALKSTPLESQVSEEALARAEADAAMAKRWDQKQNLLKELAEYKCPNCNHVWHDEDPRLKDYEDVPETRPVPQYTASQIKEHRAINAYQETRKTYLEGIEKLEAVVAATSDHTEVIESIRQAQRKIDQYNTRLEAEAQRLELQEQRNAIEFPDDVSGVIQQIEDQQKLVDAYLVKLKRHQEAVEAIKDFPENLQELKEKTEAQLLDYLAYKERQVSYEQAMATYLENKKKLEDAEAEKKDWEAVKESLVLLRSRIKGYLLPSLNEVASRLLALMSNGWLNKIEITEDFDVTVDGKLIHKLSGAGKALTNMALRIGLGQVLTNSVFSTLILDEADAGVDKDKAPLVAEALRKLTGTISQIIVISHKEGIESDHQIKLEFSDV